MREPEIARGALVFELILLFVGLPLGYRFSPVRLPALPVLWFVAGYAWWQLRRDSSFDRRRLWKMVPLRSQLGSIVPLFLLIAAMIWAGVHWFASGLEWSFLRQHPALWGLVMVLYPILSVYPQGVVYRAFFLHRYAGLFPVTKTGELTLLIASGVAFGFLHIIFRNPLAVIFTLLGGILFARRYKETGALFVSNFEHALYGCWLFTVGLGQYFYHGVLPSSH